MILFEFECYYLKLTAKIPSKTKQFNESASGLQNITFESNNKEFQFSDGQ